MKARLSNMRLRDSFCIGVILLGAGLPATAQPIPKTHRAKIKPSLAPPLSAEDRKVDIPEKNRELSQRGRNSVAVLGRAVGVEGDHDLDQGAPRGLEEGDLAV